MLGILLNFAGMSCHRQDSAPPWATASSSGQTNGVDGTEQTDAWEFPLPTLDEPLATEPGRREVVLAGGCFWCTEAVFEKLQGILEVESGYAGGTAETARYDLVSQGTTGHAEAIRIVYDPSKITLGRLFMVFFHIAHDPTQLNRQGADMGRQYRSAIFFADQAQETIARAYIHQLNQARVFQQPIVTTLEPLTAFYPAESYHQDFARRHPNQPYVRGVADPKVQKLQAQYPDRLKP